MFFYPTALFTVPKSPLLTSRNYEVREEEVNDDFLKLLGKRKLWRK